MSWDHGRAGSMVQSEPTADRVSCNEQEVRALADREAGSGSGPDTIVGSELMVGKDEGSRKIPGAEGFQNSPTAAWYLSRPGPLKF